MADTHQIIGRRLRAARREVGLSQKEVATILKLPRPTISYIESGLRTVKVEELVKFAQLYHQSVDYFLKGLEVREEIESPISVLFRAEEVTEVDQEPLIKGFELCKRYSELEEILGLEKGSVPLLFDDIPRPKTKGVAIQQGAEVAKKMRYLLHLGAAPINSMAELLALQGVRVMECFFQTISGVFIYAQEVGPCVLVKRKDHKVRKNFTLAHEYGHLLLDRRMKISVDSFDYYEIDGNPIETRSNAFAADFLMPADALSQFFTSIGIQKPKGNDFNPYDICHIAHYFQLSHTAILWRLLNLNFLTRKKFDQLRDVDWRDVVKVFNLSQEGEEGEEDQLVTTERLRHMVIEAYRRSLISLGKLGKYLDMDLIKVKEFISKAQITPYDNER